MRTGCEFRRIALARLLTLVRSKQGAFALWFVGTLAILAAVAVSGDVALLVWIADRELLVLVVESAAVYATYAWRSGARAVAWAMFRTTGWLWAVRFHVVSMRWSF